MKHADHEHKIFLHPGDFYFSDEPMHIHTILGSCIAITLWHPVKKIGGMCHFVLEKRFVSMAASKKAGRYEASNVKLDGRYALDAMELFRRALTARGTKFNQYQAKIFGGSNTLTNVINEDEETVGMRNAEAAFNLVMESGAEIQVAHVGESGHRRIVFDTDSGDVWVKHEAGDGHRLQSMSGTT